MSEYRAPEAVLRQYFGYDSFRPGQREMIDAILSGSDVLGIMPTGAGKSICYQVPALIMDGITIVISPLISLMIDQVQALNQAGIHAAYINSALTERQISLALTYAARGRYKIIYVAPERLLSPEFQHFADSVKISVIAVDEAHCVSQWGQDFRPSYLKIREFADHFHVRPVVAAFTATATSHVAGDITAELGLRNPKRLVTGFDRPNLYFAVGRPSNKMAWLVEYVASHSGKSGIIYCSTRRNVDQVYEVLRSEGVAVGRYHAGMDAQERKKSQEAFIRDERPVMVATNAFGMGIDKPDVRYVVHYNMPQSMENYYQEAGRAGRDGEEAEAILLYHVQDVIIAKFLLDHKEFPEGMSAEDILHLKDHDRARLKSMEKYASTTKCLRNYILRYFGEHPKAPCGKCSSCQHAFYEVKDPADERKYAAYREDAKKTAKGRRKRSDYGRESYGSSYDRDSYGRRYGSCDRGEAGWEDITAIEEKNIGGWYGPGRHDPCASIDFTKRRQTLPKADDTLSAEQKELLDRLDALRKEIARENGVAPYMIFNLRTLKDMCRRMPKDRDEMLRIGGMTQIKYDNYGWRFLDLIRGEED